MTERVIRVGGVDGRPVCRRGNDDVSFLDLSSADIFLLMLMVMIMNIMMVFLSDYRRLYA